MKRLHIAIALVALLCGTVADVAQACSVPVFRWALERWQAEDYQLHLFRDKPLSKEEQTLIEAAIAAPANVTLREIDVRDEIDTAAEAIWNENKDRELPFAVLNYPQASRIIRPAVGSPLNQICADALRDSPARREIAKRTLDGQSGVWIFLASGDAEKDSATFAILKEQIAKANRTLKLPDMTGDEALQAPDAPDVSRLRVEFSVIEVRRDDPAEAMFVRMLLGIESDLPDYDEPMAFPVYGRGRVLYALVGRGINTDTVMKANAFLVGPCACEIKADNPGTDLLMAVNWGEGIGKTVIGKIDAPPLAGTALPPTVETVTLAPARAMDNGDVVRNAAIASAAVIVLVGMASWGFMWSRRR